MALHAGKRHRNPQADFPRHRTPPSSLTRVARCLMCRISCVRGAHRQVFLTKSYVLKVPRRDAVSSGRRANRTETDTWKTTHNKDLCPVICGSASGWFIIMPFARPLTDEEFDEFLEKDAQTLSSPFIPNYGSDFKRSNYGMLNGQLVKIDYGGIDP